MNTVSGQFEGKIHVLNLRIYYEDTDFSGIVYHANFLKYAERGRSDYLRLIGVHHTELRDATPALAFAVTRMEMDFIAPARIDDVLEVRTCFSQARGARLIGTQKITRDGTPLWSARVWAACIDMDGKPKRLPPKITEKINAYLTPDAL